MPTETVRPNVTHRRDLALAYLLNAVQLIRKTWIKPKTCWQKELSAFSTSFAQSTGHTGNRENGLNAGNLHHDNARMRNAYWYTLTNVKASNDGSASRTAAPTSGAEERPPARQ